MEIFQSKREVFYIKATIWKFEEGSRYTFPDSHVKAD